MHQSHLPSRSPHLPREYIPFIPAEVQLPTTQPSLSWFCCPGAVSQPQPQPAAFLHLKQESDINLWVSTSKECSQPFRRVLLKHPFIWLQINEKYWWEQKKCTEPSRLSPRNSLLSTLQSLHPHPPFMLEVDYGLVRTDNCTISLHALLGALVQQVSLKVWILGTSQFVLSLWNLHQNLRQELTVIPQWHLTTCNSSIYIVLSKTTLFYWLPWEFTMRRLAIFRPWENESLEKMKQRREYNLHFWGPHTLVEIIVETF